MHAVLDISGIYIQGSQRDPLHHPTPALRVPHTMCLLRVVLIAQQAIKIGEHFKSQIGLLHHIIWDGGQIALDDLDT